MEDTRRPVRSAALPWVIRLLVQGVAAVVYLFASYSFGWWLVEMGQHDFPVEFRPLSGAVSALTFALLSIGAILFKVPNGYWPVPVPAFVVVSVAAFFMYWIGYLGAFHARPNLLSEFHVWESVWALQHIAFPLNAVLVLPVALFSRLLPVTFRTRVVIASTLLVIPVAYSIALFAASPE